ncbi:MAG TPA: serine/threonine-protein kinase [Myxococcaceae bacterium]|nr:serine/threonine-protein kinase [Myxococcaceae bacterium]
MKDRIYKPGEQVAHYEVLELLGVGGFSAVYKAQDLKDSPQSAPSAVKISRFDFDTVPESLRHELNARTRREFDLLQHLEHRSIISVLEPGFHEGVAWYAMEWLEGYESLGSYLVRERRRYWELALLFRQLAAALAHAHRAGVVHRDVTPGNILVSPKAEVLDEVEADDFGASSQPTPRKRARVPVLIDFGIAHALGVAPVTAPGAFLGTAEYLPPEYARAVLEGVREPYRSAPYDDVYQAGVILYAMLTGRLPTLTPASQLAGLLREIRTVPPLHVRSVNPDAPPSLAELAMRCLEKRGSRRPADGAELLWRFNAAMYEDSEHLVRLAPEYRVGEPGVAPNRPPLALSEPEQLVSVNVDLGSTRLGSGGDARDDRMPLPLVRGLTTLAWASAMAFFFVLGQLMSQGDVFIQWDAPRDGSPVSEMGEKGRRVRVLVPRNPASWQMKPPCRPGDVELNRGCWVGPIKGMAIPCAPDYYEYNNECYVPRAGAPNTPNSLDGGYGGDSDGGTSLPQDWRPPELLSE